MPLLQGRNFEAQDKLGSQRVVIVDEALANSFFPSQNPLGQQIGVRMDVGSTNVCTVIGVVPHVRHNSPDYQQTAFHAYFPSNQYNFDFQILILRSTGDPAALIPAIRKAVASIDPDVPVAKADSLDNLIDKKL
jgi:putative ABC transport system permease protein